MLPYVVVCTGVSVLCFCVVLIVTAYMCDRILMLAIDTCIDVCSVTLSIAYIDLLPSALSMRNLICATPCQSADCTRSLQSIVATSCRPAYGLCHGQCDPAYGSVAREYNIAASGVNDACRVCCKCRIGLIRSNACNAFIAHNDSNTTSVGAHDAHCTCNSYGILARRYECTAHSQTEKLFGLINGVLGDARCSYEDVDIVALTVGPGSFTGARVGLAAVQGMCYAREILSKSAKCSNMRCHGYHSPANVVCEGDVSVRCTSCCDAQCSDGVIMGLARSQQAISGKSCCVVCSKAIGNDMLIMPITTTRSVAYGFAVHKYSVRFGGKNDDVGHLSCAVHGNACDAGCIIINAVIPAGRTSLYLQRFALHVSRPMVTSCAKDTTCMRSMRCDVCGKSDMFTADTPVNVRRTQPICGLHSMSDIMVVNGDDLQSKMATVSESGMGKYEVFCGVLPYDVHCILKRRFDVLDPVDILHDDPIGNGADVVACGNNCDKCVFYTIHPDSDHVACAAWSAICDTSCGDVGSMVHSTRDYDFEPEYVRKPTAEVSVG